MEQSFCPLVTRTSPGFPLNYSSFSTFTRDLGLRTRARLFSLKCKLRNCKLKSNDKLACSQPITVNKLNRAQVPKKKGKQKKYTAYYKALADKKSLRILSGS